jgi:hypothetical protein
VSFAVGAELAVAGLGPCVGSPAVASEVAEGVAEPLFGGPPEGDGVVSARGAGGGCDAGEAGERLGVGEQAAVPVDMSERRALVDARLEFADLGAQALEDGDEGESDSTAGVAFVAGDAMCGSVESGEELDPGSCGAVAVGPQPGAEAFLGQPGRPGGRREPLQEPQADGAVNVTEQPDGAGDVTRRWARSWLATATRVSTRSLRARTWERRVTLAGESGSRPGQW